MRRFSLGIADSIKHLGGMSHAGSMGAGVARASDSKFKSACRAAVFSNYFDRFVLLIILLNCIQMALKGPDPPGHTSSFTSSSGGVDALDIIDMVCLPPCQPPPNDV